MEESDDGLPVDYEQTLLVVHHRSEVDDFQLGTDRGYRIERSIGRGHFGVAFLVKDGENQRRVLKALELDRGDARREAEIMRQLRHPQIIRFRDSFEEKGFLAIVMDHAACGDLLKRVDVAKKAGHPLQEEQVMQWVTQALLGLRYLHGLCIIHRDIKNENLFLDSEDKLRIGDFGLAMKLKKATEIFIEQQIVGTPLYLSPEICAKGMYSMASDLWAIGCSLFELLSLQLPFEAANLPCLLVKITTATAAPRPNCNSQDLADLCVWLLTKSRMSRPSAAEVLSHRFLQPVVSALEEGGRVSARKVQVGSVSRQASRAKLSPLEGGYPIPLEPLPSPLLRTHGERREEVSLGLRLTRGAGADGTLVPGSMNASLGKSKAGPEGSLEAKNQQRSDAVGSPQHWLRRSKSGKQAPLDEDLMQSQPTLKLVEPQVSTREDHRQVLEAEVISPKALPGVVPPANLRVKRSKSSGALETRTPRNAAAPGAAGALAKVVPPPLKFGKIQPSNGSKSARAAKVMPRLNSARSIYSARVQRPPSRAKSPSTAEAPRVRMASKDPVPRTRSPDPPPAAPAADAPGSRGRVKFAPPAVRQNPLRAALKGAAAFRAAARQPSSARRAAPRRAASATAKGREAKDGAAKQVVQPLLLQPEQPQEGVLHVLRRSPSAPPPRLVQNGAPKGAS